jgi:hypothetical protein
MTLRGSAGNETGNTLEAGHDFAPADWDTSDNHHPPHSESSLTIRLRHVPKTECATEDLSGCGGTLSVLAASLCDTIIVKVLRTRTCGQSPDQVSIAWGSPCRGKTGRMSLKLYLRASHYASICRLEEVDSWLRGPPAKPTSAVCAMGCKAEPTHTETRHLRGSAVPRSQRVDGGR